MKQPTSSILGLSLLVLVFLTVLLLEAVLAEETRPVTSLFHAERICDVRVRVQHGCSFTVPEVTSRRACLSRCATNRTCNGASTDSQGRCFMHHECRAMYKCSVAEPDHVFMSKLCQNGGVWNSTQSRCVCQGFWVGMRCQEYPKSCLEILGMTTHRSNNNIYYLDIDPKSKTPLPVYCLISRLVNYYNVRIMVNEGNSNFNLSWDEFRDGVYDYDDAKGNEDGTTPPIWVGLRQIHLLTNQPQVVYHLVIAVQIDGIGQTYQLYKNFKLSDERDGFKISYTSHYTDINQAFQDREIFFGTCIQGFENVSFSAWDRDQDVSTTENCAARRGSGWWFKGCDNLCNLMGWRPDYWDSTDHANKQAQGKGQPFSVPGVDLSMFQDTLVRVVMYMSPLG